MAIKPASSHEWTFLSNHGHVLVHLSRDENARIRDIALAVGITERSVQGILADLLELGYISVTRVGRRNQYSINKKSLFRHPAEENKPISALLRIFS